MRKILLPIISFFMSTSVMSAADPQPQYSMVVGAPQLETESESAPSHFTWGADLGSSIDMTGQDLTAIDLDAEFGYKGDYIRFAGLGAGIRMMVSNSSRCYPVYAMFRSSFTRKPSLCFAQLKLGVSFNNFYTNTYQRDLYTNLGIGFTLATGRSFSSHIILSYEFVPVRRKFVPDAVSPLSDIHSASISIGVSF